MGLGHSLRRLPPRFIHAGGHTLHIFFCHFLFSPLSQTHSITSIPSLLIFSSNGHLITNEGVQLLQVRTLPCFRLQLSPV